MHMLMLLFKPVIRPTAWPRVRNQVSHNTTEFAAYQRQLNKTPRLSYSPRTIRWESH